jgi:hypothetical protein
VNQTKIMKMKTPNRSMFQPLQRCLLPLCAALALPFTVAHAQSTIVSYTFDNTTPALPAPAIGSSISSISGTGGPFYQGTGSWATGSETGTKFGVFSGASGVGKSIDISLNAAGYQNITLGSFFQFAANNNTAAVNWQFSYSLDGGSSFTQIGSDFAIILTGAGNSENTHITTGSNFALGAGADNNANIIFRFNSAPGSLDFNGATASGGQIKIDNFNILATPIPEPSTAALLSLCGLATLALRRRRG